MNIGRNALAIIFLVLTSYATGEPNDLAKLAKDDKWGEPNNGLVTQLIPQSEEYVIGKPMKFGLVLKNISDSAKEHNRMVTIFKPLTVKTPDNNYPYDKIGPFSTQALQDESIDPCMVVILLENYDITEEYVILKPGKYTVQFRGKPASNIIEIEVKPGTPDERDLLVATLLSIIPEPNWQVIAPKIPPDKYENKKMVVLGRGFKTEGSARAILWLTKSQEEPFEQRQFVTIDKYLGKNSLGYFYIQMQPKALEYWPSIKEDIIKALKLEGEPEPNK